MKRREERKGKEEKTYPFILRSSGDEIFLDHPLGLGFDVIRTSLGETQEATKARDGGSRQSRKDLGKYIQEVVDYSL